MLCSIWILRHIPGRAAFQHRDIASVPLRNNVISSPPLMEASKLMPACAYNSSSALIFSGGSSGLGRSTYRVVEHAAAYRYRRRCCDRGRNLCNQCKCGSHLLIVYRIRNMPPHPSPVRPSINCRNCQAVRTAAVPAVCIFSLWVSALIYRMKGAVLSTFRCVFYLPVVTGSVAVTVVWKWMFNNYYGIFNYVGKGLGVVDNNINWLGDERFALWCIILILFTTSVGQYLCCGSVRLTLRAGSGQSTGNC